MKPMVTIQILMENIAQHNFHPRTDSAEIFRRVHCELNAEADLLAGREDPCWHMENYDTPYPLLRLQFDGSSTDTQAGCGWILYGACHVEDDDECKWTCVAWHAFKLPQKVSCTAAELEALAAGVHFVAAYLQSSHEAQRCLQSCQPWDFSKSKDFLLYEVV